MSGTPDSGMIRDKVPSPEEFEGVDKAIILALIFVFLGLVVWLSYRSDQRLYQYLAFIALLTLVFVGILRAAGVIRTGWLVLGGSAAVYIGLLWATSTSFDRYDAQEGKIDALNSKIDRLQKQLEAYQGQDLRIVTFDATNQKSIQYVKFHYGLNTGADDDAQYDETDHHYFIPAAKLPDLQVIWIEFNLLGAGAAEHAGDAQKSFRVERLNLRLKPLQLELYVSIKQQA
jgi:hypothetical protein